MKLKSLFIFLLASTFSLSAHATEIKMALIAPEGSTWVNVMVDWNKELSAKTAGRVSLKLYPGGVLGDERDVLRKMRLGQVHAAGFTGLGLGLIDPEIRLLELPMLAQDYAQLDKVAQKFQPQFANGFKKKGFELLAWTETGYIYILSNSPIASQADMKGLKMWAWEGDQLVEAMYKRFNLVPIPLALPDVLTSLQTKLVDAVYAPPLGAVALQWFTRTKYITNLKLANSTGGIVMTQKALVGITPADQQILRSTAKKYGDILVKKIREDNETAYQTLLQSGLTAVEVPAAELAKIRSTSLQVWDDLAGKLYSAELLQQLKATVPAQ